ncbi:hypothetical protein NKK48_22235 [Mesorhizobium sp. C386A]|uniref:hypothetical protein n=1 Tax=Mesorhizobium sp. C386A TaxID=2956831 RepID=UPI00333D3985
MFNLGAKTCFAQSRAPNDQKRVSWALKSRALLRILGQDEIRRNIETKAKLSDAEGLPRLGLKQRGPKEKNCKSEQ